MTLVCLNFEAVVYKSFCIAGLDYRAENNKHP